ncbi:MAG: lipid A biosynthesis acyltransferase [Sulfurovum sp.]|nr:MAG: lipid A biosynthesis acyltransferase [Sulfurovum sp.]RUM75508.1 MAG: lipid A biosynthesis acyltransferase [Sulfurovum sp.]
MIDYFYLGIYKLFAILLRIFPDNIVRMMMKGLAKTAYGLSAKHRTIIDKNLELAFVSSLSKSQKQNIGIAAFMNLIDTVFGIVKRDGLAKAEVIKKVSFEGEENIKQYQAEGKKFILVTGHFGNWELLSQAIAIKFDMTLVGVGRQLDSKIMDALLKKNREQFNVEMVYKKGAMKGCIKAINEGKTVGILTDQAIRKNQSIEVDFFGKKATHTPLASILSRKFDLDLIPAYISTEDYEHYTVKIYEPIKSIKTDNQEEDLAILTQQQADIMESVIKKYPKQWFWMHKRWK